VDYHDHEQWLYIIMEYIPAGELSDFTQKNGPMPEVMVKTVARQILHALDYLHRRKITHRDIKPDNILISSFYQLRVKLSDFGLSKVVNNQETFLKTFCGTLLYCAPEVYPEYDQYRRGERKRRRVGDP
jgi:serine/threonine protein kinase